MMESENTLSIQCGPYEVFKSGTVIQFENEPITLTLNQKLSLEFRFMQNRTRKPHTESQLIGSTLVFDMVNFDQPNTHLTTANPVPIASMDQRKLYFGYSISVNGNSSRTLHYTFYLAPEDFQQ